jgi:hypothetical protein
MANKIINYKELNGISSKNKDFYANINFFAAIINFLAANICFLFVLMT